MTLKEFKEKSYDLSVELLNNILLTISDKNIEPLTKQKLIATALSLLLYVQDELTAMLNSSDESISE